MEISRGQIWMNLASRKRHRVLEAMVNGKDEVITWSIETTVMGQGETFLGDRSQFEREFSFVLPK